MNLRYCKYLYFTVLIFSITTGFQGFGQDLTIKKLNGQLVDSLTNKPLAFATISLLNLKDSSFYSGTISDTLGQFSFNDVQIESLYAVVNYLGYKEKLIILNQEHRRNINLGTIRLIKKTNILEEVIIIGNSNYIMNVDRSIYRPDSTALSKVVTSIDLFQKIPELKVDRNAKTISIVGKPTIILLNGVMQQGIFDINTINPKDIEKVEIINNPSSKYSTYFEGVINIVLKKRLTKGFTALVNLDYMIKKKNESLLMMQYSINKTRFFANYYFNYWAIPLENKINRNQDDGINLTDYQSEYVTKIKKEFAHTGKFGFDYYLNDKNFLNFSAQINTNRRNDVADFISKQQFNNLKVYSLKSEQTTKGALLFQNYSLFYKRDIDSLGKQLSSDINFYFMNSDYKTSYSDTYDYPDTNTVQRSQNDIGYKNSINYHLDYIHPYSDKSRFETGLQLYYQNFTDKLNTDNELSTFHYSELKPIFYIDYYTKISKYNIKIGLRYEHSRRIVNDSTFNKSFFLPALRITRKINNHIISINYNRRAYYPSIWQLSPEITMIDSLNRSSGNPYLSAQQNNVYEINYRFKKGGNFFSSTIYHIQSNDVIRNIYIINNDILIRKPFNAAKRRVFGFKTNGSFVLWEDLEIQPYFNVFYDEYSYEKDITNLFTYNAELSIDYFLPIGLYIGIDLGYLNKSLQPQGYIVSNPQINSIYLQKSLFKGNGSIMLSYQNLFLNTTEIYIDDVLFSQENISTISSSGFFIRFSYWFSKGKRIESKRRKEFMEQDVKL